MVRKNPCSSSNETTVVHPQTAYTDVQATPQKEKPYSEVIIKLHDMYVRAGDCECEKLIFDNDRDGSHIPKSPQITVRPSVCIKIIFFCFFFCYIEIGIVYF